MISRLLLHLTTWSSLLLLSPAALAAHFTGLYVFGDSLSDRKNVHTLTFGLYPPAEYADGRLSNGPVWVETLAETYLGLPAPTASLQGGTNYAYGGAATDSAGLENPFAPFTIPSLKSQVSLFLNGVGSFGPDDLVTVWGAANDFIGGGQTNPATPVANLSAVISSLAEAGARTIIVPNLPDLGDTPRFRQLGTEASQQISQLTTTFNSLLALELTQLQTAYPDLNLVPLDVYSLAKEVTSHPEAYGLINVTDPALGVNDGTGYMYWDDLHPTTQMHAEIARAAAVALGLPIPEPGLISLLSFAGFTLIRRRRAA